MLSDQVDPRQMGGTSACSTQTNGGRSFAFTPPHTLSFNVTIQLQAVRLPIERRMHARASRSSPTRPQHIIRHTTRLARLSGPSAGPFERAGGHQPHPHRQSGALKAGGRDK